MKRAARLLKSTCSGLVGCVERGAAGAGVLRTVAERSVSNGAMPSKPDHFSAGANDQLVDVFPEDLTAFPCGLLILSARRRQADEIPGQFETVGGTSHAPTEVVSFFLPGGATGGFPPGQG